MSTITDEGKRIQTEALAKALVGGRYCAYDGDHHLLGEVTFPQEFELTAPDEMRFASFTIGKFTRDGLMRHFACFQKDNTAPLLSGTIGTRVAKGEGVQVDDLQVYRNMDFEVTEFRHRINID